MKNRFLVAVLILAACGWHSSSTAQAAVVVLANRTDRAIRFRVSSAPEQSREYTLPKGDVLPIAQTASVEVIFSSGSTTHRCRLEADSVYCFLGLEKSLELRQIGFGGSWGRPAKKVVKVDAAPPVGRVAEPSRFLLKIPVKVLVDRAEPTVRKVWEKRLRQRIQSASDILERECRVRLEVIEVGTWESDDSLKTLTELLRDFQRKTTVKPARLVLGFTGQPAPKNGDSALGCTPGPLHTHILIREWKPRTEPERLEVLLHELGHFLGAGHSPEAESVMRPKLGDGRATLRAFRIGLDPVNALVCNLVAEEMARRPVRSFAELSPETRSRLIDIFSTLARAMPDDPAALHFVRLLGGTPPEPMRTKELPAGVVDGARTVVVAIVSAAERNARLSPQTEADGERARLTKDELTAHYYRVAAAASKRLPAEHAVPAYLLGLAVALDRSSLLHALPLRGIPWEKIETETERARRLRVLGEPTMHGRHTLAQNFAVSAALNELVDGPALSPGGILEELLLIQGGTGFRFDDLAANLAGITFAMQLDASPGLLAELEHSFRVADYTLAPTGLSDALSRNEFARKYGSLSDDRFLSKQDALRKLLLDLPGYQPRPPQPVSR